MCSPHTAVFNNSARTPELCDAVAFCALDDEHPGQCEPIKEQGRGSCRWRARCTLPKGHEAQGERHLIDSRSEVWQDPL